MKEVSELRELKKERKMIIADTIQSFYYDHKSESLVFIKNNEVLSFKEALERKLITVEEFNDNSTEKFERKVYYVSLNESEFDSILRLTCFQSSRKHQTKIDIIKNSDNINIKEEKDYFLVTFNNKKFYLKKCYRKFEVFFDQKTHKNKKVYFSYFSPSPAESPAELHIFGDTFEIKEKIKETAKQMNQKYTFDSFFCVWKIKVSINDAVQFIKNFSTLSDYEIVLCTRDLELLYS